MKKNHNLFNYLVILLAIFVIYVVAGKFSLSMAFYNKSSSPIWLGTGIAISALLIFGYRFWPAIFAGAFLVNIFTTPSIPVSLGIALGNTLESLAGIYLINTFAKGKKVFENINSGAGFFVIAVIVPVISAIIGTWSLVAGGFTNPSNISVVGLTWWIGDVIGAFLLVPLLISNCYNFRSKIKKERYVELILAATILLVIVLIIFLGWPIQINGIYPFAFICMLPLLWIALRSCVKMTAVAAVGVSAVATWGTIFRLSIFNTTSINTSLILLQAFIGIITPIVICMSVLASTRKK